MVARRQRSSLSCKAGTVVRRLLQPPFLRDRHPAVHVETEFNLWQRGARGLERPRIGCGGVEIFFGVA